MASTGDSTIDGFDGFLYDLPFPVPTYDNSSATYNTLSWHDVDLFYQSNASSTLLNAIGFSICLVSLLYVVVLTPSNKRKLHIHTFLTLALVFKLIDRGIALSLLLHSPDVSAYINLTVDVAHVELSDGFKARVAALQIGAVLTFTCLQACLFIHGKPLLTTIKLSHKKMYRMVMVYLVMAGWLAFALRITLMVMILSNLSKPLGPTGRQYHSIYQATIVAFAVSIASWSLVFFCSSVIILIRRRKQLVSRNKVYESVLNMIAIIGLESFIMPLAIAILQLVPRINIILSNSPEVLLVPSVLLILPLASVFGSSRAGQLSVSSFTAGKHETTHDARVPLNIRGYQDRYESLSPNIGQDNTRNSSLVCQNVLAIMDRGGKTPEHPLELELRRIDAMGDDQMRNHLS